MSTTRRETLLALSLHSPPRGPSKNGASVNTYPARMKGRERQKTKEETILIYLIQSSEKHSRSTVGNNEEMKEWRLPGAATYNAIVLVDWGRSWRT